MVTPFDEVKMSLDEKYVGTNSISLKFQTLVNANYSKVRNLSKFWSQTDILSRNCVVKVGRNGPPLESKVLVLSVFYSLTYIAFNVCENDIVNPTGMLIVSARFDKSGEK